MHAHSIDIIYFTMLKAFGKVLIYVHVDIDVIQKAIAPITNLVQLFILLLHQVIHYHGVSSIYYNNKDL